jgi:penicillin-binding protein 1A
MKKWVDENKKPDGSDYIYKDGLKIYTTIDSRMQLHAEEAVSAHMANLQEEYSGKKRIKRSICGISDKETQRILTNAMKASTDTLPKSAMAQNAQHTDNFFI